MKKVLLSLAAVTAIAAAAPAAAQPYGVAHGYHNNHHRADRVSINERERQMAWKIDTAVRKGNLHPAQANRLMAELRRVEALEQHYRRGGLSRWEREEIDRRLDYVQSQLKTALRNERYYSSGYGRW